MKSKLVLAWCVFVLAVGCAGQPRAPQTALGDWGHFLAYTPRLHFDNPEGSAFELTFHLMQWPSERWNPEEVWVRVEGPEGEEILWRTFEVAGNRLAVAVPAAGAGVYTVDWGRAEEGRNRGGNFWVEANLPRSVVWTGDYSNDPEERDTAVEKRRAIFLSIVPRRWWFWVPAGTSEFRIKAQRSDRHMSQREDWGLTVFSPRGQRTAALWGQPPKTGGYRQEMEAVVEVEPGNSGRFWSVEVRNGDSHQYSNVNLALDGVPPFLARSPEEWFDGDTGEVPLIALYDEEPFMQAAYFPKDEARWPALQHWSPSPSLGDPDGSMILGEASIAVWNPEGRDLSLQFGDYLPRNSGGRIDDQRISVQFGTDAERPRDFSKPHYHENVEPPRQTPELSEAGVHRMAVSGAERWFAFTYPATPIVLEGTKEGRFHLEIANARNWYFRVPPGTESFFLNFETGDPEQIAHIAVNAPDRTVAVFHHAAGGARIAVPEGAAGKIWHLRLDVASSSRLRTPPGADARYIAVNLMLELQGVPALLAPTWEQWFDPEEPHRPRERQP